LAFEAGLDRHAVFHWEVLLLSLAERNAFFIKGCSLSRYKTENKGSELLFTNLLGFDNHQKLFISSLLKIIWSLKWDGSLDQVSTLLVPFGTNTHLMP